MKPSPRRPDEFFAVGKIATAHGIRGQVKVYPSTDYPELRFACGSRLVAGDSDSALVVSSVRAQPPFYVVDFEGVDSREAAEALKGTILFVERTEAPGLDDDEYWLSDIVGCAVVTTEGDDLGVIDDVIVGAANDVYVVVAKDGTETLIPAIKDVVKSVDMGARLITIEPMPGLLD